MTEYLRPDVIAKVRRLDLRARFIVDGFYAGLHASPYHGFSVEFSEHRKYEPGDELRTIDWNVYGKTDRLYVKKYRAETNLTAHLLLDTSGSMAYPVEADLEPGASPRMTKFDYAACLAAALAYLMLDQQDAVGLALVGGDDRAMIPARSRRTQLTHVLARLARAKAGGVTTLADDLEAFARRLRRRGLVIVFSDLLCDPVPVQRALRRLRFAGQDAIVFCVLDAAEAHFPFRGPTRFEDPETGGSVTADAEAFREGYLRAVEEFHQSYRDALAGFRAELVCVDTSMSFDQALARFLTARKRRF
ncbi:MAG: DUF58 domain-containing protein [Phycisphaerae bacterium]|nr:DUF58 domain-containing protein [Phycisphaerae bacterium]